MRRTVVVGIAAALIPIASSAASAADDPSQAPRSQAPQSSAPERAGEQHSVTLITGDRVVVTDGRQDTRVIPAVGREHVRMLTYRGGGHRYVVPSDAVGLLHRGKLDRRLFDVDALVGMGYDDAHRASIPLLAAGSGGRSVLQGIAGTTVRRVLPAIGGEALSAAKSSTGALWRSLTGRTPGALGAGTDAVWLDGKRHALLDKSVPQIGAPVAWQAGYTGKGTTIAILDTGVDDTHPDLAGREKLEKNFSDATDGGDHFGHGTHVASIATGTGAKSKGKYRGVAYEATYLDGKVLDDSGSGQESWIIAGLQWAADQHATVANLSLGGSDAPGIDPLEKAVNRLSASSDTLFVIAAGNEGPDAGTVGSPGSADAALTVGAVDDHDRLADFSSRGPRIGDGAIKPDLTAPGVGIVAARHSDGTIGPPVAPGYTELSGTSMATPHVAGAVALLAQQHPKLHGEQLKGLLTASAKPGTGLTAFQQGTGRVDSARALSQNVYSDPGSVSFGVQQWPHQDDKPVTKKLTYANTGTKPVTLTLALQAGGPGGIAAPKGMFRLSKPKLTVPAGGRASVTVTGNTRTAPRNGTYSGALTASAGKTSVRTAIAVEREVESYDVTVKHTGRDGKPDPNATATVVDIANPKFDFVAPVDGVSKLRLPKGRYYLEADSFGGTQDKPTSDLLIQPTLVVDRDRVIDADARKARPISLTVPNPSAEVQGSTFSAEVHQGDAYFGFGLILLGAFDDTRTALLGPKPEPGRVSSSLDTSATAGDDYYGLAYPVPGTVPTGFSRAPKQAELATVRENYGRVQDGMDAFIGVGPHYPVDPGLGAGYLLLPHQVPATRTEYLNTDGVTWSHGLIMSEGDGDEVSATVDSPPAAYRAGRTYTGSVNHAVYGTSIPDLNGAGVFRSGNAVTMSTPLFGDATGGYGASTVDTAYTRVFRDGKKIAENDYAGGGDFTFPAADGAYRISTGATRSGFDLSPSVSSEWTFRSAKTAKQTALPLSELRFTPTLDGANSAPGNTAFTVPVQVRRQLGGPVYVPKKLTAQVSYDKGRTWQPAKVVGNRELMLRHPAGPGFVSLRATATDAAGNTVRQTILNAYALH